MQNLFLGLRLVSPCVLLILSIGCARTNVQMMLDYGGDQPLPRPSRILVHDFDLTPYDVGLDISPGKDIPRGVSGTSEAVAQDQVGTKVASALSDRLVDELQKLGLPAQRAALATPAPGTTYTVEGLFLTVDEGNRMARFVVGFGVGAAEVTTQVQVYAVADGGYRQVLQEFRATAKSSRRPGMGVMTGAGAIAGRAGTSAAISGTSNVVSEKLSGEIAALAEASAKEIVKRMKPFLVRQGWIPG